ncbi:hypothetical protein LSH36_120g12004 [Paralvinella palmiformis]|uniref:Uncharacterized protein n=1 Tax=Paralvinella palmiformis TaxID=53620 RepID=A0AAD9NA87_9ANNE|nr:hypothetical protein LSH36_120g12004 [Paralvinella palmiformis]
MIHFTHHDSTQGLSGLLNTELLRGKINVPGLIGVVFFYIVILVVGIVASWWGMRKAKHQNSTETEEVMLAGRNIGLFVGIFTMTGGIFFARKMRDAGYVTILDPFRQRYGRVMAALLYIPALLGDVFWTAAILSALGASLSVIIGLNHVWAVLFSAAIAILYTFIGGLYSVAYTDVIQLICIIVGLVYFQRVLSQKTSGGATILSLAAGFACIILAIPAAIIGAIAASTDWNATNYREFGEIPVPASDYALALPMVMQFLTPVPVAVIGLGAVSAAVMSSADSSVLSSSSMFARNVYKPLRDALASTCWNGQEASEYEIVWVMRVALIIVGVSAAVLGIKVQSVYALWYLCADLIYVILFPQLFCVIYLPFTNVYGSLTGYIVGFIIRLLGGESLLNIKPVIYYPWYDEVSGCQLFPFKTLTMLISLVTIAVSSFFFAMLFGSHLVDVEANSYIMTAGDDSNDHDGERDSKYHRKNKDTNISCQF